MSYATTAPHVVQGTALGRHPVDSQNRSVRSGSRSLSGRIGWHDSRPPSYEYGVGQIGRRRFRRHTKRGRIRRRGYAKGQLHGMVMPGGAAAQYHAPRPAPFGGSQFGSTLPPRGYAGKKACCKSCEQGGSCEGCDGKGGCGKDCGCKG